ncbi:dihydrofolate reductase [Gordonia sp. SID5947]|uniref:dihydrofolate reductase family protein n=1 Tax=Gordonia sp. SID5947 TaxID=2690315 RepID=UPI001369FE21|nr:dihydrofolate reductase [Gordonia sp. SID5947]MYR07320.1 dihydrofolate reductase [Gordonia sp. SID5947]
MTTVIFYGMNVSADGYIVDAEGGFDWTEPADDVFAYYIGVQRDSVLDVYGRNLWETMQPWVQPPPESSPAELEYAEAWQSTPRLVVSTTLTEVDGAELVHTVDDVTDREGPVQVGGAALAASMIDRIEQFLPMIHPVTVGGGVPFFPAGVRLDLELVETRRFDSGPVLHRYVRR